MAQARNQRAAGGPAGWVVLLGLMVLALVIAAASKGCGDDTTTVGGGTPTTGTTTVTPPPGTGNSKAQAVIDQVQKEITNSGGIQFTTGQSELTTESKTTLDGIAKLFAQNPAVKAEVQGHTDSQGDDAKNQTLSDSRANVVKDYLVLKGVKASQLTAKGYGETAPLVSPESTDEARKKNRRVAFKLIT